MDFSMTVFVFCFEALWRRCCAVFEYNLSSFEDPKCFAKAGKINFSDFFY